MLSSGAVTDTDPRARRLTLHEARALWRRGEFRSCLNLVTEAAEAWSQSLDETDKDLLLASRERSNAMHGLGLFTEVLERTSRSTTDWSAAWGKTTRTLFGPPACSPSAIAGWGTFRPHGSWTSTP